MIASRRNQRMANAKGKIVECQTCHRIMKICTDMETTSDTDHLYVMSASNSLLPGLVKIGRSKNPLQRAIDLQDGQPYHIIIHAVFWGAGSREKEVHKQLRISNIETLPGRSGSNFQCSTRVSRSRASCSQTCRSPGAAKPKTSTTKWPSRSRSSSLRASFRRRPACARSA